MQKIELKNKLGKVYFTVEYNRTTDVIYANWLGFVSVEEVITGATKCLEAFESTKCSNFINDNRLLTGPWNKANDWIANTWMPRALKAGLKNFAFVMSPNIFGELSAKDLETHLDNIGFVMKNFKDYDLATAWIKSRIEERNSVAAG